MAGGNVSNLDLAQILQRVYDDETQTLGTTATAVNFQGELEVAISDQDDSIQIGDGTNRLKINPDGSVTVVVESGAPTTNAIVKNAYSEVTSVGSGITTTVITYTVPVSNTAVLERVTISGENIALFTLKVNGTTVDVFRTYYLNLNGIFNFLTGNSNGYTLNTGDVVTVSVLHTQSSVANFESRIQVIEINS